jgi:hypothetical protein
MLPTHDNRLIIGLADKAQVVSSSEHEGNMHAA